MNKLFDIRDKVIAVTGAAGVLAGGTARYLQEQGAHVGYLDLFKDKVDETVAEAKAISDKGCGRIDVLIKGAGGNDRSGPGCV